MRRKSPLVPGAVARMVSGQGFRRFLGGGASIVGSGSGGGEPVSVGFE